MGLPIRVIGPPRWLEQPVDGHHRVLRIGDAWYGTWDGYRWLVYPDGQEIRLAPQHRDATPICVMLPGEVNPFCLHVGRTEDPSQGWTVSGDLEHPSTLSVSPSINITGEWTDPDTGEKHTLQRWHGHLTAGVLEPG